MDSSFDFACVAHLDCEFDFQALASCKDFRSFLQWVIEDARDTVAGELDQQFPLTLALSALLEGNITNLIYLSL